MDPISFWKSINLNTELSLAGSFIYNGLKAFDDMTTFHHEEEIFEFLYNISVGVERLAKIAIIVNEKITLTNSEQFEKTLITHNHMELVKRVTGRDRIFDSVHNSLLHILTNFYNSWRYDRYSLANVRNYDKEKQALTEYIEKFQKSPINRDEFFPTPNNVKIKKFIGKTVGKIVIYLYEKIEDTSRRENVYTYEIRHDSKASKIFLKKQFDFIHEDILWKEILLYVLSKKGNEHVELYMSQPPLEFDEADIPNLVASLKNETLRQEFTDMLDVLYEDVKNKSKRFEFLDLIGSGDIYFHDDDEGFDDDKT